MVNKEKTHSTSNFKFKIFQGNEMIVERGFNADVFNPIIRYSVDIRKMIPSITQRLQKVMSRRNLNYIDNGYNYLELYKDVISFYKVDENKLSKPLYSKYTHSDKTIKGVECKFGLYINNNPIVERTIYVDNYNPACRFSTEIIETVNDISHDIHESLKELDVDYMWGDYVLNNTYGLYHYHIRELSKTRRAELVDNFQDIGFVKKVKSTYRNQHHSNS